MSVCQKWRLILILFDLRLGAGLGQVKIPSLLPSSRPASTKMFKSYFAFAVLVASAARCFPTPTLGGDNENGLERRVTHTGRVRLNYLLDAFTIQLLIHRQMHTGHMVSPRLGQLRLTGRRQRAYCCRFNRHVQRWGQL